MYYCDPTWHNSQVTDADYLILSPEDKQGEFTRYSNGFAVCAEHTERALSIMCSYYPYVRVRRVRNPNKKPETTVKTSAVI